MKARRPHALRPRRKSADRRLEVERFEDRTLMATFLVTNNADTGTGSLRDAITAANAQPGVDLIQFSLPANERTIIPATALPAFTDAGTTLDGTSQPGYTPGRPVVEISGQAIGGGVSGLVLTGGNITIKGLVINRWSGDGIQITTRGNNVVSGNFIGVDVTGTQALPNSSGVNLGSNVSGNVIGGTTVAERNVISGNTSYGVFLNGAPRNTVQGNYIGTNAAGDAKLGNGGIGVSSFVAAGNTIGGTAPGAGNVISGNNTGLLLQASGAQTNLVAGNYIGTNAAGNAELGNTFNGMTVLGSGQNTIGGTNGVGRNVISGNGRAGIQIQGSTARLNIVRGNYIGVGANGTTPIGNATEGVWNFGGVDNFIGGLNVGDGNIIANNGALFNNDGVYVNGGSGVQIASNSIYNNVALGIHLSTGSNNSILAPTITSAQTAAGLINILGSFTGAPNSQYTVQFFGNKVVDASGAGEGRTLIQPTTNTTGLSISTNGAGIGIIDTRLPLPAGIVLGDYLTATLTREAVGDTSEFSVARQIGVAPTTDLSVSITPPATPILLATNFNYTVNVSNLGPSDSTSSVVTVNVDPTLQVVTASAPYTTNGSTLTFNLSSLAASATRTFTITVKPTLVGAISTSASLAAKEIDPNADNDTTGTVGNVLPAVDLDLSVEASDPPHLVGSNLTYFLAAKNAGPSVAQNVRISFTLPAGTTFVSGNLSTSGIVQYDSATGVVTATVPSVPVGPSGFFNYSVIIRPDQVGSLDAQFAILANENDVATGNNTASKSVQIVPASDLSVKVTTAPSVIEVGQQFTYTVTVTNSGPSAATGVTVSDVLDPTVDFVSASIAGTFDPATRTFTAPLASIAAGGTTSFTITATPTVSKQVTNTATVGNSVELDPTSDNNTNAVAVPISPLDLSVVGSLSPDPAFIGQDLAFTYKVRNAGPSTATNVILTANLPGSATFVSSTPGGAVVVGSKATLNIGTLAPGAETTVVIHVTPTVSGRIAGSASVASDETDTNAANNSVTVDGVVSPADVAVSTVVDTAQPIIGENATIQVTVRNNGPATATNVVLTDVLTGNFRIVSATSTAGVVTRPSGGVNLTLGSLPSGASAVLTIVVNATATGAIGSTATVSAGEFDPVSGNNQSTASLTYINTPGIVQFATAAATVDETAGTVTITVTRVKGTLGAASVNYGTVDVTAKAGVNYAATSGTLNFADGETSKSFVIPIIHDGIITKNLTFGVSLSGSTSAAIGSPSSLIVTVVNTDLDLISPQVASLTPTVVGKAITSFVVGFSELVDPATAARAENYTLWASTKSGDVQIPVSGVSYNPDDNRVTVVPGFALGHNVFYRVVVNGTTPTGVQDVWGNLLDGAGNGGHATNFAGSAAAGTKLSYLDATGNIVNLKLTGGGYLTMSRYTSGDGIQLQLSGVVGRAKQVLSGSVKRAAAGANGVTRINTLAGIGSFGDVYVSMTTPPFYVKNISGLKASAVKGLLPKTPKVKKTVGKAVPAGPLAKD